MYTESPELGCVEGQSEGSQPMEEIWREGVTALKGVPPLALILRGNGHISVGSTHAFLSSQVLVFMDCER